MKIESRVCAKVASAAIMTALLATVPLLSGCAVSLLGGAARSGGSGSAGSTSAPAPRPASQATADSAISTSVRSRLAANASLRGLKLAVDTHDGVVTLRGQVNNVEQRNAAQLDARAVKGVRAVKNELSVKQ
jgi:hyperosmotically inducible periplasmic protein